MSNCSCTPGTSQHEAASEGNRGGPYLCMTQFLWQLGPTVRVPLSPELAHLAGPRWFALGYLDPHGPSDPQASQYVHPQQHVFALNQVGGSNLKCLLLGCYLPPHLRHVSSFLKRRSVDMGVLSPHAQKGFRKRWNALELSRCARRICTKKKNASLKIPWSGVAYLCLTTTWYLSN